MLPRRINPTEVQLQVINPSDFAVSYQDSLVAVFLGQTRELLFMRMPGVSPNVGLRLVPRIIAQTISFQIREIDQDEMMY